MPATFASLQDRVNDAVVAHLADVDVTIGAVSGRGLFNAAFADPLGVSGTRPVLRVLAADFPAVVRGSAVAIGADTYEVLTVEPDGAGMHRLTLRAT